MTTRRPFSGGPDLAEAFAVVDALARALLEEPEDDEDATLPGPTVTGMPFGSTSVPSALPTDRDSPPTFTIAGSSVTLEELAAAAEADVAVAVATCVVAGDGVVTTTVVVPPGLLVVTATGCANAADIIVSAAKAAMKRLFIEDSLGLVENKSKGTTGLSVGL